MERQKAALYSLKGTLKSFTSDLREHLRRYKATVDALQGEGLSQEVHHTYLNSYFERDRQYIEQLIRHMEEADTKYVNDNLHETGVNIDVANKSLGDF